MNKDKAISALNKTKERLFKKGWVQGGYGERSGPNCLAGALQMVEVGSFYRVTDFSFSLSQYLNGVIEDTTGFHTIASFNDSGGTRFDDVIALIDTSIKRLESSD